MMRSSEDNKADYEGSSNRKATRREVNLRQVNIVDAGQILKEEEEEEEEEKNALSLSLSLSLCLVARITVLVVRNDLKMGKGKIAAQCSHATLGLYKKLVRRAPKALDCWEECAQPKVVVKIETEDEMLELQERAKTLKLPTHITIDAGRTQIAPNSRTVMAILGK
ncbi:hypothetical protein F2Q69_00044710 [Brassica cretica]|uniref:peptidyl-tRNA hydrolase n=1 Tax=Brassica cretica TaxID=69181 RepID=A0A8S9NW84_BRACR|nr:hypothetical protein F2Q69_00044710 [Brassica cretica]